jgi:cytochrome c
MKMRFTQTHRMELLLLTLGLGILACGLFPLFLKASDIPSGDAANGKVLFEKRCTGCHALNVDKEGPRLGNVYGRKAGTVATFKYSDALKNSVVIWDEASLNKWLNDPDAFIPDNDMAYHVAKQDERADIIHYLRQSSGK